jgi:hypothetical protein
MSCILVVVITISPHFDTHEYAANYVKTQKPLNKQEYTNIVNILLQQHITYCIMAKNHSLYIMHLVNPCTLPCKNHPFCHYLTSMPGTKINVICKTKINTRQKTPENEVREKGCKKEEGNIISRGRLVPSGCVSVYQRGFQSQFARKNRRFFFLANDAYQMTMLPFLF